MKLLDFPTSAKEALATGHTYFMSHRECSIHHTAFHWAHNGACMACFDVDGNPYLVRAQHGRIRRKNPNEPA